MGEFDKINNGMIVNNFNQLFNRRDCEIFCMKYHKLELPVICISLIEVCKIHKSANHRHAMKVTNLEFPDKYCIIKGHIFAMFDKANIRVKCMNFITFAPAP